MSKTNKYKKEEVRQFKGKNKRKFRREKLREKEFAAEVFVPDVFNTIKYSL